MEMLSPWLANKQGPDRILRDWSLRKGKEVAIEINMDLIENTNDQCNMIQRIIMNTGVIPVVIQYGTAAAGGQRLVQMSPATKAGFA
jgi:hypothetical protein